MTAFTPEQKAKIYGLYDPVTGELRYIGKADNTSSRLASHMRDARRRDTPVYQWIRSLGRAPNIKVISESFDFWEDEEKRLIALHRSAGADLLNVAVGGGQPKTSKEQLQRAAKTANQKRPKYLMQAYRMIECNIRMKGLPPETVEKGKAAKAKLMADADFARANGTMAKLDEACRLMMEGRVHAKT